MKLITGPTLKDIHKEDGMKWTTEYIKNNFQPVITATLSSMGQTKGTKVELILMGTILTGECGVVFWGYRC